jgi:LPS-assembly lipoprotein
MRTLLLLSVLLLTACGFHLRGHAGLPFNTLYLEAANLNTPFIDELRRNLEINNVRLVNTADKADVILNIASEMPEKQILSLSGSGLVNEFQIRYRVSVHAYDLKQQEWIPTEELLLQRYYTYDNNQVLAKEAEEALLYKSMRTDMVQQIVRRLSHAKPQPQE